MYECDGMSNANAPCRVVHGDKTTWMHVETKPMEDEGNDAWIEDGVPDGMGGRGKIGNVGNALPFLEDAYVEQHNEDGKPWCCHQVAEDAIYLPNATLASQGNRIERGRRPSKSMQRGLVHPIHTCSYAESQAT